MGAKTDPALVAVMRQEFMAGATLRDLAEKHNLGLRTLARASKDGGWEADRVRQLCCQAVPMLARAADQRVETVEKGWQSRLGNILNSTGEITERVASLLVRQDLSRENYQDLASLLRILTGSLESLRKLIPADPVPPSENVWQFNITTAVYSG